MPFGVRSGSDLLPRPGSSEVLECGLDVDWETPCVWLTPIVVRHDRDVPNSVRTVHTTVSDRIDGVEYGDIVNAISDASTAAVGAGVGTVFPSQAAARAAF